MKAETIKAEKRKTLGRKVKNLRQQGILPANLYGKKIKSEAVQVDLKDFVKIYEKVGETGLVNLMVGEEKEGHPILVTNVQKDPVKDFFLHADFRQVVLTEKVKATIPVELIGKASAEAQKTGILLQMISEVEVEALPADLPEKLTVDISKLEKVDDSVTIKDLQTDREKVKIETDENQIVAKIEHLAKEEIVAPPVEAVPTEGVTPPEAGKTEVTGEQVKPEEQPLKKEQK